MSGRSGRAPRILVFGESLNDSRSGRELIVAANGRIDPRSVIALPRPMSLTRDAGRAAVRKWVEDLDRAVRAHRAGGPVAGVVVHRDADGPDIEGSVEAALRTQLAPIAGCPVVPVHTIEAWWFLFPDAIEAVRPTAWRGVMPRSRRDVETIERPKEHLRELTRKHRGTEYSEADSPLIAARIRELGLTPSGSSASYGRMTATACALG